MSVYDTISSGKFQRNNVTIQKKWAFFEINFQKLLHFFEKPVIILSVVFI